MAGLIARIPSVNGGTLPTSTPCRYKQEVENMMTGKSWYVQEYYNSTAGAPGAETVFEREKRERFWRSIRKQVEKGR